MFTEIGIENFKAFGKMQHIPLKPITLLYGPNSSGKSSLLQSLLLFKQTLEEATDDKIVLLPKGNLVDLGGYQEFIHGHDTRKDFRLSISFKYSWNMMAFNPVEENGKIADLSQEVSFSQDKSGEVFLKTINIKESIHPDVIMEWKNIWSIPYLKRAVLKRKKDLENSGMPFQECEKWISDLNRSVLVLDSMNMENYLLKTYWHEGYNPKGYNEKNYGINNKKKVERPSDCEDNEAALKKLKKHIEEQYQKIEAKRNELNANTKGWEEKKLQKEKDLLKIREAKVRQLKKILRFSKRIHSSMVNNSYEEFMKIRDFPATDRLSSVTNCFPQDKFEFNLTGKESMFQNIVEFTEIGSVSSDWKFEKLLNDQAEHYVPDIYSSFFAAAPLLLPQASEYFKEYLRRIAYIGPLREYPERVYSYSGNVPSHVGKSGKYTPDILLKRPELRDKVNTWFQKFDIGYTLKVDSLKRNLFSLGLVDKKTGYEVSPKDVGFGIGQLLPIVVQGVLSENKIMLIEQPEIHVHPRLQAEMGSFFSEMAGRIDINSDDIGFDAIDAAYGNQFIIETHSEHLVLRLLRIIRDTTNGELKEGEKPLRPEDVAVIYAKPTENGTELMELRISEDGDFIDKWPDGFFTEREKELF